MTAWQDFPVDREITTPSVTVTETHVVQFGMLTGDWYPLHMNAEWAARTQFGKRIAHGPFIFSLAVGLMYQSGCYGDSILAWLGADKVQASAPVFIGDTVHVVARVIASRPSKKPGLGVVTLLYTVITQTGEPVMSFEFGLLMRSNL